MVGFLYKLRFNVEVPVLSCSFLSTSSACAAALWVLVLRRGEAVTFNGLFVACYPVGFYVLSASDASLVYVQYKD